MAKDYVAKLAAPEAMPLRQLRWHQNRPLPAKSKKPLRGNPTWELTQFLLACGTPTASQLIQYFVYVVYVVSYRLMKHDADDY